MKKTIISLISAMAILFVSLFASACGAEALAAPEAFDLDDDYRLSWEAVQDANTYVLEIKAVDGETVNENTRRTSFSLNNLEEGDYEIRLKSVGAGYEDSPWSEIIYFHKDFENGCLYELINDNTEYKVSKINKASGVVDLGDYYRGKPVTAIGERAFRGTNKLTEVIFGKYVEVVEDSAFFNCSKLVSITFSDALREIGPSAFQSCSVLESVALPEGVTEIAEYTFMYCRALSSFTAPSLVKIGDSAFYGCSAFANYDMPSGLEYIASNAFTSTGFTEIKIGDSVKSIGQNSFSSCGELQTVEFSDKGNLKTIEAYAFANDKKLTSLTLPDGLETVGAQCFVGALALADISIPDSVTSVGTDAFSRTAIYYNQVTDEEEEVFVYADDWLVAASRAVYANTVLIGASNITNTEGSPTLILREGIVGIADQVFNGCQSLQQFRLSRSVKYIGRYEFYKCKELWEFWATEGCSLEIIGDGAFIACEKLYNVILNSGLKEIRKQAFYNCSALDNNTQNPYVLTPTTLESIGIAAFDGTMLYNNTADNAVVYAGKWAVANKLPVVPDGELIAGATEITLNEDTRGIADYALSGANINAVINLHGVRYIGRGAFSGCTSLSTVTLSSSVSEIKPYTFYNCSRLFSMSGMPVMLEKIGECAFYGCTRLSTLDLTQSAMGVKEIGDYAFFGCTNLRNRQSDDETTQVVADGIKLGNSLTRIGNYAFYNCSELDEVIIPNSVTEIGFRAFGTCYNLETVIFGDSVETIGDYAFMYSALKEVDLPNSVKSIGDFAFYKCEDLLSVNLGGATTVGDYAFAGAYRLAEVSFPKGLKTIGNQAFRGCVSLSGLTLPAGIEKVGTHAFYSGTSLTFYSEDEERNEYWAGNWNSLFRPVILNVTLSDEGYVLSLTVTETTFTNAEAIGGISAPLRKGYAFLGWAEEEGGQPVYAASEIASAPTGATLYAVWQQS